MAIVKDKVENRFELVVVEGSRTGARAALSSEGMTTIGTAFDCDIVLTGDSEQVHRIEVLAETGSFKVQIVEGSLTIDGATSDTTEVFYVAPETRIALGNSVFILQTYGGSIGGSIEAPGGSIDTPASDMPPPVKAKSRFATLASSAVLGLGLVVAGVATYLIGGNDNQTVEQVAPNISQLIEDNGYYNVAVEATSDTAYQVRGRVATRSEHIALKSMLETTSNEIDLDVSIDEVFTDDVAAIYRLNGVDATVELTGPGAVDVVTSVANITLLDDVEARAYQDVPGLTELVRFNTLPPVLAEDETPDFTVLPGKRIKMVVTTEPAFILTEDGSRYFKGAVLPSGYKIKSIFEKTVQLERDNKIVDFVF